MNDSHRGSVAGLVLVLALVGCSAKAPTACQIGDTLYSEGAVNPASACQSCQPALNTLGWSQQVGVPCDAGASPDAGPLDAGAPTGCVIDGIEVADGVVNPQNPCQSCQLAVLGSGWTNLPLGSDCGGGGLCSGGTCIIACLIDGGIVSSGTTDSTGCFACLPSQNRESLSELRDGTACDSLGSPGVCYSGECQLGCDIDGTLWGPANTNFQNACQSCQPSTSISSWTDLPSGTPCGNGGQCQGGTCVQGSACVIGGATYPRGATNPSDRSQCCSPAFSTSDWTGRLQDGGTYDLGPWVTGLAVADFNQDGRIDIAGVNWGGGTGTPTMSVMLRRADGTFAPAVVYPVTADGWGIAAGDLNGDGFPDLVLLGGVDQGFTVFMNLADGTGGFSPVNDTYSSLVYGESFALEDLDGDGAKDLALGGDQMYFLKGHGDGGFGDPLGNRIPFTSSNPGIWSTVAGRFGPGQNLGVATANGWENSISVLLGNGDGTFALQTTISQGIFARSIAAGDFNGDGFDDLALEGDSGDLVITLSNGDGTFGAPTSYTSSGGFVTMADLDGDGRAEVLAADWYGSNTLTVHWNTADGGISATSYGAGTTPASVVAADLNGDGILDVAVGNVSGGVNLYVNGCP